MILELWNEPTATTESYSDDCETDDEQLRRTRRRRRRKTIKDQILVAMEHEIGQYTLISHLTYAMWSVVQYDRASGSVDFDYMAYGHHRMEGYYHFKNRYWQ